MILFWILWGIDAIVGVVTLYFFFVGLADGSVSSFNGGLWLVILVVLAALLGGSLLLKSADHLALAKSLLALLAIPALLFGLYMLIAIFSGAKWN
jgi:hypothetical protein